MDNPLYTLAEKPGLVDPATRRQRLAAVEPVVEKYSPRRSLFIMVVGDLLAFGLFGAACYALYVMGAGR